MAGTITMRQPEVTLTKNIKASLQTVLECENIDEDFKKSCKYILCDECSTISTKLLRNVYKSLRENGHKVWLHEIVENADLVLPEVNLPPRNPELEARIRKLKIEQENKEYKKMTRNVSVAKDKAFTFGEEVKSMNRQIVGVLNFLVTVGAGFAFGYKVAELAFGNVLPLKMMSGLVVGTVIFFVDLYFMLKYGPL